MDRRNDILDFIEKNYGYSTKDIAKELDIGRTTVTKYIQELLKEGLILNLSNQINKNKLVPNKNNEIVITRNRISNFKEKYYNLLDTSLKHPQVAKVKDKINPESNLWDDMMTYGEIFEKLYSEFDSANEIYSQKKVLVRGTQNTFSELANKKIFAEEAKPMFLSDYDGSGLTPIEILHKRIANIKTVGPNLKGHTPKILENEISAIENLAEQIVSDIDKITRALEKYSIHIVKSGYFVLTYWPVFLFFLLEYSINLKSVITWPNKIVDKKLLFELNDFVYDQFKEMKGKLIEYLSESKNRRIEHDIEKIMNNINPLLEEDYFIRMFYDYSALKMRGNIMDIINSLMEIREKTIQYDEQEILGLIYQKAKAFLDT